MGIGGQTKYDFKLVSSFLYQCEMLPFLLSCLFPLSCFYFTFLLLKLLTYCAVYGDLTHFQASFSYAFCVQLNSALINTS